MKNSTTARHIAIARLRIEIRGGNDVRSTEQLDELRPSYEVITTRPAATYTRGHYQRLGDEPAIDAV